MTLLNSGTVSRRFFDARASFALRAAGADITYTLKAGDSYYGIARDHLVHGGIQNPSQAQIVDSVERIAAANGTRTDDCRRGWTRPRRPLPSRRRARPSCSAPPPA